MGFATVRGGATSHVAILARSLGIPALAGIEARMELPNGTPVILDGSKGTPAAESFPGRDLLLGRGRCAFECQRQYRSLPNTCGTGSVSRAGNSFSI